MTKLGNLCGKPVARRLLASNSKILAACSDQQIGIEIEVENMRRGQQGLPYGWREDQDGSLRNGIELKTDGPVLAKFVEQYVRDALGWLNERRATTSIRTGLHIHLDATRLDVEHGEPLAFMMAYLLVEPALYRYVGDLRQTLMFCQPMYHTPTVLPQIKEMLSTTSANTFARKNPGRELKYSGLNVNALMEFGTVEFRHAAMTLNVEEFIRWIEIVVSIMKFAEGMSPDRLAAMIIKDSQAVVNSIFQGNAALLPGPYNEALALTFAQDVVLPLKKIRPSGEEWVKSKTEAHMEFLGHKVHSKEDAPIPKKAKQPNSVTQARTTNATVVETEPRLFIEAIDRHFMEQERIFTTTTPRARRAN